MGGWGNKVCFLKWKKKKMNDLLKLFKFISGSKFVDQEFFNGSCFRLAYFERKDDYVYLCVLLVICEIFR